MRRILSRAWIFGQPSMRRSVRTGRRSRADTDSWVREVAPQRDSWKGLAARHQTAQPLSWSDIGAGQPDLLETVIGMRPATFLLLLAGGMRCVL